MKSKSIVLTSLLLGILFSCSQEKIVELPLTLQNDHSPFAVSILSAMNPNSENENSPWKNTYLNISIFPEGLTDMKYGHIETNIYQSVYQDYLLGNITREWYEELQESWKWIPDTLNLSKIPVKTKIAFVYGKAAGGILKIAVDTNGNLDLSDDRLFTAFDGTSFYRSPNKDSLIRTHSFNVPFEIFVQNKIIPVSVPLFIIHNSQYNLLMYTLSPYATTHYKGEQIAVSQNKIYVSYENPRLAFINNLKQGELIKEEDIYRKDEYIEIKDKIYKILGVNTKNFTLVLEKTDLSKAQLFSTQVGHKAHPFQGVEFTTKSIISLESLKGKHVLLDFWAAWCGPCIQEFPHLKELYSKTDKSKFEIIGIVGNTPSDALKKLIDQHEITWSQILSDETNKITEKYGINSYPTTLLIDTEGVIIAKDLRGKELEEKILSLIKN